MIRTLPSFLPSVVLAGLVAGACGDLARGDTWTSADGQSTLEGTFVSLADDQVTMTIDGRDTTFGLDHLSAADRNKVRGLAEAQNAEPTEVQEQFEGRLDVLDGRRMGRFEFTEAPQYFILYYSASWCPPCRELAPHSVEFYGEEIADDPRVELIMVSADTNEGAAESWAEDEHMPWPILPASEEERVPVASQHSPRGIPHMVLVDGEGNMLASGRVNEMRAALRDLPTD